jgi:DNA polymerase delta subunit 3
MYSDEAMADAPAEADDAPIDKPVSKPTESESAVTVQGGRRRGRRRVFKKTQVQDEDGFIGMSESDVLVCVFCAN